MIAPTAPSPSFACGQLVKHRRYDYRGVVVAFDRYCQAPENWYQSNRTQPERNQPWYHVLVHGSGTVTYAAQTSLEPDESDQPIDHPLVDQFFDHFTGESYHRNDRPWPG